MKTIQSSGGIYCIYNKVNFKCYVGYTNNFKNRKKEHFVLLNANKHHSCYLQSSFNKYGKDNFIFQILELVEEQNFSSLASKEHLWCSFFKSHDKKHGYNIAPTSLEGRKEMNEETKKKISKALKGRKLSKESIAKGVETRKKIAEKRGYWISPEQVKETALKLKGRKRDPQLIKKLAEINKGNKYNLGRKLTQERIDKIVNSTIKEIDIFDIEGNFIKTVKNIAAFSREIDVKVNNLRQCLLGRQKQCKGYMIRYSEPIKTMSPLQYKVRRNCKVQCKCLISDKIEIFENAKIASLQTGVSLSKIRHNLIRKSKQTCNKIFTYVDY